MSIWRDEIGRALAEVHSLEERMRLDGAPIYKAEFDSICARLGTAFRGADAADKEAAERVWAADTPRMPEGIRTDPEYLWSFACTAASMAAVEAITGNVTDVIVKAISAPHRIMDERQ